MVVQPYYNISATGGTLTFSMPTTYWTAKQKSIKMTQLDEIKTLLHSIESDMDDKDEEIVSLREEVDKKEDLITRLETEIEDLKLQLETLEEDFEELKDKFTQNEETEETT